MMWARIEDEIVVELTDVNPEGRYVPEMKWVECPDNVQPEWIYANDRFYPSIDTHELNIRDPEWLCDQVDLIRVAHERAGLRYDFNGNSDVIQTRDDTDIRNINGQVTRALVHWKINGITDPIMPWCALSDITYMLTPEQMIQMGSAVNDHITALYGYGWYLKLQIRALKDDPEALAALDLTAGWPE